MLVTGGAGFIGSNLVGALLENGAEVRVIDDLSTGRRENLSGKLRDLTFIHGDICDDEALGKALRGVAYVFHQAALPSVPRSIEDPLTVDAVNARGTLKMLLASLAAGVKRVVYASSSSVYGDSPSLPKLESMPVDPKSPYALSKYCGERYCQLFHALYGLETVSLRYFNVFGPRQDPGSFYAAVIPRFISRILKGESITIFGEGKQTRDFTYVENVVHANLLAAERNEAAGEVINIACGQRMSVMELAEAIMGRDRKRVEITWAPPRPGDVRDSLASIEKAKRLLGYRPVVSAREGLRRTISWLSEGGNCLQ